MSLKIIKTKFQFEQERKKEVKDGFILYCRAVDDEIYRVLFYRYVSPVKTTSYLESVEYLSTEKFNKIYQ